jgi:hypothetical protein
MCRGKLITASIYPAFGFCFPVELGFVADISKEHSASIIRAEVPEVFIKLQF